MKLAAALIISLIAATSLAVEPDYDVEKVEVGFIAQPEIGDEVIVNYGRGEGTRSEHAVGYAGYVEDDTPAAEPRFRVFSAPGQPAGPAHREPSRFLYWLHDAEDAL